MRIPTILAAACLMLAGCSKQGCTDPEASNYKRRAVEDDGSCEYPPEIDGYTYDVVTIGSQLWFAENLRTTVYANGDPIPSGLTVTDWVVGTGDAMTTYGEGSLECQHFSPDLDACDEAQSLAEYGRLYNFYAVNDERGLCPGGWHVPNEADWRELKDYLTAQGFAGTEGTALRSTTGWVNNGNGTDDFGFSGLPGGWRKATSPGSQDFDYHFDQAGQWGNFWASEYTFFMALISWTEEITFWATGPEMGLSVRCLRDAE